MVGISPAKNQNLPAQRVTQAMVGEQPDWLGASPAKGQDLPAQRKFQAPEGKNQGSGLLLGLLCRLLLCRPGA